MDSSNHFRHVRWASLAFVAGGVLMAVLWIIFTNVHGPTSFDLTREVLGRSTFFWGSLLSVPPSLLIALGLILLYQPLAMKARRLSRLGYTLTLISIITPSAMDLFIWGALGPPLFVPVLGIGLVLLAAGNWGNLKFQRQSLYILLLIGISQLLAFALVLIPNNVSDQFDGYRIYGFFAHFLSGIGWLLLGNSFWKTRMPLVSEAALK